jgi:hypothetical protein
MAFCSKIFERRKNEQKLAAKTDTLSSLTAEVFCSEIDFESKIFELIRKEAIAVLLQPS